MYTRQDFTEKLRRYGRVSDGHMKQYNLRPCIVGRITMRFAGVPILLHEQKQKQKPA